MGEVEQMIARQARNTRQPLPDRIANAPQLEESLWFYMQAFFDLQSERSQGLGPGQIPWRAIVHYGEYYSLNFNEIEVLIGHVRSLDSASLNWTYNNGAKK